MTDLLYNVRRKKEAKYSLYDELSVSEMKEAAELVKDLLCLRRHTVLSTLHSRLRRGISFAAAPSTQDDGLSSSLSFGSKDMCMGSTES